jgi:large subunit ribosomal protein L4
MALRVVLSQKLREGRLTVVPSLDVEPRTRVVAAALRKRDMASALFVDDVIEEGLRRAVANAPRVDALPQIGANVYDILRRDRWRGGWWGANFIYCPRAPRACPLWRPLDTPGLLQD